ncbi:ABC transporter permease [Chitinophaga pinensis]|uniref:ABC transporter permease n=1 Tax=Chitinophaga pinensis TaxID=79329 RepID=UPI0016481479|nr:ABC transporter permease [Chitinophaga pinensis]
METAVRLETLFGQIISLPGTTRKFEESRNICFTESQFFQVFDVDWKAGDKHKALDAEDGVVLSERYALKYFGTTDVIGRTLRINNQQELTVNGLIGDPPSNTRLGYDIMVSYNLIAQGNKADWNNTSSLCFVAMKPQQTMGQLQQALQKINQQYLSAEQTSLLHFQALPLSELSHNTQYGGTVPRPLLYVLTVIGILLVAAACINFINMATAQSIKRSKETGIRKAVGSTRSQLVIEFLTETAMVTLVAVMMSVIIVQLCLPWLNNALSVLRADMSVLWLFRPHFLSWFLVLIVGVILLSGLYPALVLSRFTPIAVLQGRVNSIRTRGASLRKVLVVTQFLSPNSLS